jgi:chromate transporter
MQKLLQLFWTFLKINLLSTSGPASAALLHAEAVGRFMTEEQFVEAVGFSSALPGSDALQLAMFVGYYAGGVPGALVACAGATLPPTVIMLGISMILERIRGETWVSGFVRGLTPAVAVLLALTAVRVFGEAGWQDAWQWILLAASALALILFKLNPVLVVLGAGLIGVLAYR